MNFKTNKTYSNTYLNFYLSNVVEPLANIDIYIKSHDEIQLNDISILLDLEIYEIKKIISEKNIVSLNKSSFFDIMYNGSSFICGLYRREIELKSPYVYTEKEISYIYNIDEYSIKKSCEKLGIKIITSNTLPLIFNEIEI